MSHRIQFSPEALGDLIDLYDYIAQRDGAKRAIGYIDRVDAEVSIKGTVGDYAASGVTTCAAAYGSSVSNAAR